MKIAIKLLLFFSVNILFADCEDFLTTDCGMHSECEWHEDDGT